MKTIKIGTRGSRLALWQAEYIEKLLHEKYPEIKTELVVIKTEGDTDQQSSLSKIGGQGVFTKTIENALLDYKIDLAVHSLKDLPSKMTEGLRLAAVPERGPAEDVLISANGHALSDLPYNARIATGSIRRKSQLMNLRPDLLISDLRGNIETRLDKLYNQKLDGIIMARAAVVRLELKDINYAILNTVGMIPAVGQGAIGVQIREEDNAIMSLVGELNHRHTFREIAAERALLNELDSGCRFPIGGFAKITDDILVLNGFIGSEDGKIIYKEIVSGKAEKAEELGRKLAKKYKDLGADRLLIN